MPQLIVLGIWGAITAIGTTVAAGLATAAAAVGLGGVAAGLTTLTGTAIVGIATVGSVLAFNAPHHSAVNAGAQIQFKADKNAGVPYLIGRTGTGGNIVFQDTSNDGHNKWLHSFVVFSTGPVDSFVSFTANQNAINFTAQVATTAPYASKMWLNTDIGTQPASAISAPGGTGTVPEWGVNHKLSGLACARWITQADSKAYPAGLPQPLWVWKGALVYDPRLDSTYPGGVGAQRSATPSTWAWSENPYLHALTFCIGQQINAIRVVGLGAPVSAIDVAAFVTGANVADTNVWKVGGVVTTKDSKWDVLSTILQAGGGVPIRQGNQISCFVNTPLTSVATVTSAEMVGDVSVTGSQPRRTRINTITPTYRSEAHNWEMVAADPVVIAAYVAADGQARSRAVTYPLVQQVNQAAQLAYYDICNAREFGPIVLPMKARWNGLKPGDCITINDAEYGMSSQAVVVLSRQRDPATGMPTLTCRSETNAKHAAALALSGTAPPTPSLNVIDLTTVTAPGAGVWTVAGVSLTDGAGQRQSALQITGAIDNPNASGIVVEYSVASSGTWIQWPTAPASATLINITGIAPNISYDVRVSYTQRGNQGSTRTATGSPCTSGAGATTNQTFNQGTDPTGSVTVLDGAIWSDTSVSKLKMRVGGAWVIIADVTAALTTGTVMYDSSASGAYSFSIPSNALTHADIEIWGAGGGGGATHGGGGSAYSLYLNYAVTPGTTVIAGSVGAKGAGYNISPSHVATAGGGSSVTTPAMSVAGGGSGQTVAGTGGVATGGTTNTTGEAGDLGAVGNGGANLGTGGGARQTSADAYGNDYGGGGSSGNDGANSGGAGRVRITTKT